MQHLCRGDASGQCAVDPKVLRLQGVDHADLGRDGYRPLVRGAHGDVRMLVHEAGNGRLAAPVHDCGATRRREIGANGTDDAVPHQDRHVAVDGVVCRPDGIEVADEQIAPRHRHGTGLDLRFPLRRHRRRHGDRQE